MIAPLLTAALCLAAADKPTLAVLYFDNNTKNGDLDVMRKGLADMMVTDLVAWDGVTVVERDKFESVVAELKLQRTKYFDQSTAVKIGKFLEAKYLLTGSMAVSGDKLILDARLLDSSKNQVVVTARADGSKDDVFPIEQELVERIAAGIELKVKNEAGRRKAKVPSLEALLDYSKALDLTDQGKIEEAQKAFAALVSKTPTFLMARERKEQAAKAMGEYQKRKRELVTESALRVGKIADDTIAAGQDRFALLSDAEQSRILMMRQVKAQFLGRLLRRFVTEHEDSLRPIVNSRKAQALETLRAMYANQRRMIAELQILTTKGGAGSGRPELDPNFLNDLDDAYFARPERELSLDRARRDLLWFTFWGRVHDGIGDRGSDLYFSVAPTWADLSPGDAKDTWALIDQDIDAALQASDKAAPEQKRMAQRVAVSLLDQKAEMLKYLERDDDSVATYQRVLDAFPTDDNNTRRETLIKQMIGAEYEFNHDSRERWAKGLKTCEDMDLRVGSRTSDFWLRHQGVDGLEAFWKSVNAACPPSAKTRSVLDYIARNLALTAARADDCAVSKVFWERSIELGGSTSDLVGYFKNHIPWCQFGDVLKKVQWMRFSLDRRHIGLDGGYLSVRSSDGKQLALSARNERGSIEVQLYLIPSGAGWTCREATWRTRDGDQVSGTCTVKLTQEAKETGDYDEGTFTAAFAFEQDGHKMRETITEGEFRLRRH